MSLGDGDGDLDGDVGQAPAGVRGRRDDLAADAVGLHRLDERPGHDLTGRAASHLLGEFPAEVHELLDQQGIAVPCDGREPVVDLGRRAHDAHTLAVVPAARGLHDGAATVVGEEDVRARRAFSTRAQSGTGRPSSASLSRMSSLSWA